MIEPVEFLDCTTSTNQYLTNLTPKAFSGCGKAVAALNQTEGRGQRGNTWLSEPGRNILYSLLYKPNDIPARNQFLISQTVSLILKSFLSEYTKDITIKWPNDIYWKNKKIAGILIENQVSGSLISQSIIGIGLNVNQLDFPAEIPDAISLSNITGTIFDLHVLTNKLHHTLCVVLSELNMEKLEDTQRFYINNLYRRDGFHQYADKDGTFKARVCGIGPQGNLMLESEDNRLRSYHFKEVRFCE